MLHRNPPVNLFTVEAAIAFERMLEEECYNACHHYAVEEALDMQRASPNVVVAWVRATGAGHATRGEDVELGGDSGNAGGGEPAPASATSPLRLPDADELEEVLRALDRAKNRQKKSAFGSNKFRQKAPGNPAPAAAAKHVRAIQIQAPDSGSDDSGSERSDSDCDEHRRIYAAADQDNARSAGEEPNGLDRSQPDRPQHDRTNDS
ncbi:unnamed protein product [Phytophthora fragariaefolia]|uniref:Unnamed protein product n=1 Tax=Phytophthora fragariaefolia TaxID=1490495 RepID=A0A9W6XZB7_9STRA|nr:unnamed protein product [Phytophthora fragariaefolia]